MSEDHDLNTRLYLFALDKTFKEGQSHEEWVAAARYMIPTLAAGLGGAVEVPAHWQEPPAATEPAAPAAPQGPTLGPAFAGWPAAELRQILVAAQESVLARVFGASEEQLATTKKRYDDALDGLEQAYRKQKEQQG